jgi:hypothetical protein
VADHDYDTVAEAAAFGKSCFNQGTPDTHALVILVNAKRGECERRGLYRFGDDSDWTEENVPDDPVVVHSNEREIRVDVAIVPQGIYKPGFPVLCKGLEVDLEYGRGILREFRSDDIGIHLPIYDGWPDKGHTRNREEQAKRRE